MYIVKHRKIWYTLSALLIVASLVSLFVWGVKFGIDFTGGTLIETSFAELPEQPELVSALVEREIEGASVRQAGENGYFIRTPFLSPEQYAAVQADVVSRGGEVVSVDSIGPSIGSELRTRSVYAIVLVLLAISLFIAFAFRKVSKPVSSWKYGLVALLALAHDVIIPIGAFVVLGQLFGAEVDTLFVTAILVVLGFSIHDTIVVFDRLRENLKLLAEKGMEEPFEQTVGHAVNQTLARSINTSLTTVLALLGLYFFGPESAQYFTLTLLIGIIAGTYSSIFLASPLLVTIQKMQKEKPQEDKKKK